MNNARKLAALAEQLESDSPRAAAVLFYLAGRANMGLDASGSVFDAAVSDSEALIRTLERAKQERKAKLN